MKKIASLTFSSLLFLGLLHLSSCSETSSQEADNEPITEEETPTEAPKIQLSLAEWSLHKAIFAGELDHLDFATTAGDLGFTGVEYVATFFKDKAEDLAYLDQMKANADSAGVENLLIMIDGEGDLASADKVERDSAIFKHKKWVDAAKYLGCHSIRVNLFGDSQMSLEEWKKHAIEGLKGIAKYGQTKGINVIVENHGWQSSNSEWLMQVINEVNLENCGTLPDFGNFCTKRSTKEKWGGDCVEEYDKYKGVKEMMPKAFAVSAKSYDFDDKGNETTINYQQMLGIVQTAGYTGYIGVEYEGERLVEMQGIVLTKALVERYIKK